MSATNTEYIKIALNVGDQRMLYEFHKTNTLQNVIDNICKKFEKTNSQLWALQFTDGELKGKYVTENNFDQVINGVFLRLVGSINYILEWIFENKNPETFSEKLTYLPNLCNDSSVIEKIQKCNYHNQIAVFMLKAKSDHDLQSCFKSLINLFNHQIIPDIEEKFIFYLINIIKKAEPLLAISSCLELLNKMLHVKNIKYIIMEQLKIDDLITYCWRDEDIDLQLKTLALLNSVVRENNVNQQNLIDELKSPKNKNIIAKYVIQNAAKSKNIAHELCIYQTFILNSYHKLFIEEASLSYSNYSNNMMINSDYMNESRRTTIIDFEEKEIRSRTNTYTSQSSQSDRYSRSSSLDDQIDSITLRSKSQSLESLYSPVPIKKLTSKCIEFFKKKYEKNYMMTVLENQYFPGYYAICDQIIHILCEILYINNEPDEHADLFVPIIFYRDDFFEELFCRTTWLLAKTRREMRAKADEDHEKVLAVLKEQILIALTSRPIKLLELTEELKKISYLEVFENWEKKRNEQWETFLARSSNIREVQNKFQTDVEKLIRDQRLQMLKQGTCFPKIQKGKTRYWFVYLTANYRKFVYGDYDPDTGNFTSAKSEISVSDITHVVIGKASRHVKDNRIKKPEDITRCFSLLLNNENALNFLADNDVTAQYWIDGLQLLLGKPAGSKKYKEEMQAILWMELNLHLIELQNIPISLTAPVVPPLPPELREKPIVPPKSINIRQSVARKTMTIPHSSTNSD